MKTYYCKVVIGIEAENFKEAKRLFADRLKASNGLVEVELDAVEMWSDEASKLINLGQVRQGKIGDNPMEKCTECGAVSKNTEDGYAISSREGCVATIHETVVDKPESVAYLLASAPELLEWVKEVVYGKVSLEQMDKGHSLIAKAEGR